MLTWDLFTGGRGRRSLRQQYRSNIYGRWEARKEGWVKGILVCSTVPKKIQSGGCRILEPKPPAGAVPHLAILACPCTSDRFVCGNRGLIGLEEQQWGSPADYVHHSRRAKQCLSMTATYWHSFLWQMLLSNSFAVTVCYDVLSDFSWDASDLLWSQKYGM